jgi:hypothetical protein
MIDRIAQILDYAAFLPSSVMNVATRLARQADARDKARQVLKAMRPATEEMLREGIAKGISRTDDDPSWDLSYAQMTWEAMIDAADREPVVMVPISKRYSPTRNDS